MVSELKLNHLYAIVHYATFNNEQLRSEIELHGKLVRNWMLLPYEN